MYVVFEVIVGAIPVRDPVEEFKEIHEGLFEEVYVNGLFSSSDTESCSDTESPSLNVPNSPADVFQIGESFTVKIS